MTRDFDVFKKPKSLKLTNHYYILSLIFQLYFLIETVLKKNLFKNSY